MKASEIITDDVLAKDKRRTKDYVGPKKSGSQDYFGSKDKKKNGELIAPKQKNIEDKKNEE